MHFDVGTSFIFGTSLDVSKHFEVSNKFVFLLFLDLGLIILIKKWRYRKAEYVQLHVRFGNVRVIRWLHLWGFGPLPSPPYACKDLH